MQIYQLKTTRIYYLTVSVSQESRSEKKSKTIAEEFGIKAARFYEKRAMPVIATTSLSHEEWPVPELGQKEAYQRCHSR